MIHSWFFLALLGTMMGACILVIDMYLRQDGVFTDPIEPTLVTGGMQAMLWLVIPFVGFQLPENGWITLVAVLGGMAHIGALYFYFKAVFSFGDIAIISILWNLLLAMVPIMAYFLVGEVLTVEEYMGIVFLFSGALLISYSKDVNFREFSRVGVLMITAVILMAISSVFGKIAYEHTSYWSGYLLSNFGIVGGAALGYIFFLKKKTEQHLRKAVGIFFMFFVFIEFLELVGGFFLNKAVSIGPVSLVTAIESMQAFFVMIVGAIFAVGIRVFYRKKEFLAIAMQTIQLQALPVKIVAIAVMLVGAYFVS